jgi:hypothetical protein
MGVAPVHRKGKFVGVRLADELRTRVQEALHGRGGFRLDPGHGEHVGRAAPGGVSRDVEQVFRRERQAGERPRGRMPDLDRGIGHEGAGGVGRKQHPGLVSTRKLEPSTRTGTGPARFLTGD